jgi:uncharacterized protein YdeI (YjbR/CyaY-like superfamily)
MEKFDPRVDAYIAKSPDYAKPILNYLRNLVHATAPQVGETMKWGVPFFDYNGPVCQMAAFKQHAAFGYWKQNQLNDANKVLRVEEGVAGSIGKILSLADLPADNLLADLILQAIKLNEGGSAPAPKRAAAPKAGIDMPAEFADMLAANKQANEHYEKFSPSAKREYLTWIVEAKTAATRQSRMAQALEWIGEGKTRHWKYK